MRLVRSNLRGRMALAGVAATLAGLLLVPAGARACPNEDLSPSAMTVEAAGTSTLCLINERRNKNDLRKLRPDARLEQAAQTHSASMSADQFFAHESPAGSSPLDRVRAAGYLAGASAWGVAENINWGSGGEATPRSVVQRWMNSPDHRGVMLNRRYRQVGIGVTIGSPIGPALNGAIYTADFGYRK